MVGMIKKEDVEKVRAAADLYDIVSATVTLKPSGTGTFVGLCPFHDEKTGSFNVRPSLGVWHCFGCGLGGDVFKYVEQSENIDFREAVELLADKYHIELHYENSGNGPNRENTGSKRTRLLEACEEAQRFFVSQILTKEALPARKLLGGRNFSQADCERFGCGYAPQGWDNLVRHLASKGFTQKEILDAGLARQGQRGIYDYFRGRVTWPIRDSTGRTLGFGARKLYEDDQIAAKYINTPDTQLYRKTQVLYGIDLAKSAIVKKRQVVIVEGYTDVMAMHLAGIDTAIATCGTAFGAEHAKIVRRLIADDSLGAVQLVGPLKVKDQPLSSRIVFTFDGDAAGQKAALHAFGLDSAFLSQTFVAVADDNLDPCDLRIERGNEAVRSLIARAKPLYDFVIDAAISRFDLTYTPGQDRSLWDAYARKSAGRIGVDLEVMRREVMNARRQMHVRDEDAYAPKRRFERDEPRVEPGTNPYANPATRKALERRDAAEQAYFKIDDAVFIAEQQFMAVLIQVPRAIDRTMFGQLTIDHFMTSKAGGPMLNQVINELAVMPLPLPGDDGGNGAQPPQSNVPGGAGGGAAAVQLRPATPEEQRYATELLTRLLDMGFMRQIGLAKRRMAQLPDGEEKITLLGQITRMETARKDLQAQIYGNTVG